MTRAYYVAPLPPLHIISGAAFNTFTTYQSISPAPGIKIPANFLEPGTTLTLKARGHASNTATPTLLMGFFYGTAASVPFGQSGAITTTTAMAAWPWSLDYDARVRSVGTAGSMYGQGILRLPTSITAFTLSAIPITQALRTTAIDTTIEKVIGVGAAWSASSASNTITCEHFSVEVIS